MCKCMNSPDRTKDFISEHKNLLLFFIQYWLLLLLLLMSPALLPRFLLLLFDSNTHAHRAALHIVDNKRTTMFCSLTFRINKLGCMMSIIELARDRTHTHTVKRTCNQANNVNCEKSRKMKSDRVIDCYSLLGVRCSC